MTNIYMYNIYNDYKGYIQYIQLSEEVLLKYHPRAEGPRVIFQQNFQGQLYILYIARIIIIYLIYFLSIFLICNLSRHFKVGVVHTHNFAHAQLYLANSWLPQGLLYLLSLLCVF